MSNRHRRAGDVYRSTRVETSSPEQLILLLYERAISSLAHAVEHPGESRQELVRAQSIVGELTAALNPQASPELVNNLSSLYLFVQDRIGAGLTGTSSAGSVREAHDVLVTLHEGFAEGWKNTVVR